MYCNWRKREQLNGAGWHARELGGLVITNEDFMSLHHRRLAVVGLVALLAAAVPALNAQRERWERLGVAHVDGKVDHDNISVGVREGRFRAIQLRVKGGAIDFMRVVVHYADGEPEEIAVPERIPAGGMTRAIDLRGRERYIRSVELWYAQGGWRVRPEVQLFGMR